MAMIQKKSSATAKNAYGKSLDAPVKYDFSWHEYETFADVAAAADQLSEDEQRKVRNVERKTTARQAALTLALTAAGVVKPDMKNDSQLRLKSVYAGLYAKRIASGMAEADAHLESRKLAAELLGEDWDDEDDA